MRGQWRKIVAIPMIDPSEPGFWMVRLDCGHSVGFKACAFKKLRMGSKVKCIQCPDVKEAK